MAIKFNGQAKKKPIRKVAKKKKTTKKKAAKKVTVSGTTSAWSSF